MKINPQKVIHVDPDFIKENKNKPKLPTGETVTEGSLPKSKFRKILSILFVGMLIALYLYMLKDYFG